MKNKVIAVLSALIVLLGGGVAYQFGSYDVRPNRMDLYGSATNTTLASTTSAIVAIGAEYGKVNLNIKVSTTDAQTIAIVPEFSNDANCDTATYFKDTISVNDIRYVITDYATTYGSYSASLTTNDYPLLVTGTGVNYYSVQIPNLNARCFKVTLTGSSTTVPLMAWVEGFFSN